MDYPLKLSEMLNWDMKDDIIRELSSVHNNSLDALIVKALELNGFVFLTQSDLHEFIKKRCTVVQFQSVDQYVIDLGKPEQNVFLTVDNSIELTPQYKWWEREKKTTIQLDIKYRIHDFDDNKLLNHDQAKKEAGQA